MLSAKTDVCSSPFSLELLQTPYSDVGQRAKGTPAVTKNFDNILVSPINRFSCEYFVFENTKLI